MITNYTIQVDSFTFNDCTKDYDQNNDTVLIDEFKRVQTANWCFDAIPVPEGCIRCNSPLPKEYSHDLIVYSLLEYSGTVKELSHKYFVKKKD